MASISRFLLAGLPLGLAACVNFEPTTEPQTIERGAQTAERDDWCKYRTKTYRPTPDDKAPYDAAIPPTYDAPSQVPSYCNKKLGK